MGDRLPRARHALAPGAGLREGSGNRRLDVILGGRLALGLLGVGAQGLGGLGAVAVDRQRLDAAIPGLDVGVGDVLDGGGLGQVHRLAHRSTDEWLHRAEHLQVARVRDRALSDRYVEHRQVLLGQSRRADDRAVLGDVSVDLIDLLVRVAERLQRQGHGAVDDRHLTAPHQLLELDQ